MSAGWASVLQNAFWDGYFHAHVFVYQGVSYPDGMLTIKGPFAGFQTDWMVWRASFIRNQIENIRWLAVTSVSFSCHGL